MNSKKYNRKLQYCLNRDSDLAWRSLLNGILLYKKYLNSNKNVTKENNEYMSDINSIKSNITSNWTKQIKYKSKQSRILKEIHSILQNRKTTLTNDLLINSETKCLTKLHKLK